MKSGGPDACNGPECCRHSARLDRVSRQNARSRRIRVKVFACGVCRTDLHVVDGELPHPHIPIIPGHDIVGRVDALGDGVSGLTIGERVGIPWLAAVGFVDAFLDGYRKGVARLIAGDPFDPKTTLAPLSSQKAADDIKEQIRKAVSYGAKAEEVGLPVPNQGAFVQPTILTDVGEANPARYWEFFGPVSMLFRARDEDDAVRIANDSPFGLGGSVFTADEQHGFKVAKRISTGMVFVNHPTKVEADLPFGGIRRSGYGRELLGLGLKEFVNHKLIDVVDIEAHF